MPTLSLTDLVFNSDLETSSVNAIFSEIESFLNGGTASADITITGEMQASQFKTAIDGTGIGDGAYIMGGGDDAGVYWDGTDVVLEATSALTNSPQYLNFKHKTSGIPAAGIGVGIKATVETSSDNTEVGGLIEFVSTDVTGDSEDFDLVIKLMSSGSLASEVGRFQSDGKLDLVSGSAYQINGVDILSSTSLGTSVISSSLTSVGALDSGSITSGFGGIDNGDSNITTGGILKIDVDGTAKNAVGSFTLGAGNDAGIFFNGQDLVIITSGAGANGVVIDSEDDTVEIKGSGNTQATFSSLGLNLVAGDEYYIDSSSVLSATTLGAGVVTSSLTSVGVLNSGSITSGFGTINNGTSNITTGGKLLLDVDGAANDSGSLTMGAGSDSSIYFNGTDLIILTDGAGASGIILDSEDNTVEIKGSGILQATFNDQGLNLEPGDSYSINSTSLLSETTLGSSVVNSSLTSVGTLGSLDVSGNLVVSTSQLYVNSSSNKVGIGTNSPDRKVHIMDGSAGLGNGYQYSTLVVESSDTVAMGINLLSSASSSGRIYFGDPDQAAQAGIVYFHSDDSMQIDVNGSRAIKINSDPEMRVGIGTSSPGERLEIAGGDLEISSISTGTGTSVVVDANGKILKNSSSLRYKANVEGLRIDSSKIFDLQAVEYDRKSFKTVSVDIEDSKGNKSQVYSKEEVQGKYVSHEFGLIAEQVYEVLPELVFLDTEGRPDSVHYSKLSVLLLNELKKLKKEVLEIKK